jgi:hypothetical protein
MNAVVSKEQAREARLTSEMQAFFSLAMSQRRHAHEYRRWALEAEKAGNVLGYETWRKESDQQWRGAWWALRKAMERKDALNAPHK